MYTKTSDIKELISLLGNDDSNTRKNAQQKLSKVLNEEVLDLLIQALQTPNDIARDTIIQLLGVSKNPKVVPLLTEIVKGDPSISVRVSALYGLSEIATVEAEKVILEVLVSADTDVAPYGISAILKMKDKVNLEHLLSLLPHHSVIALLGELKETKAIPQLSALLYTQEFMGSAAYALSRIDGNAIDELLTALDQAESLEARLAIATSLLNSANPKIATVMFKMMEDDNPTIELLAVHWLAVRGNADIVQQILLHPNPRIASWAEAILTLHSATLKTIDIFLNLLPFKRIASLVKLAR